MSKKLLFSPASIDSLRKGVLVDPVSPGLAVEIIARTGRKRWKLRRRIPKTSVIVTMLAGFYPSVTIADAREWAEKINEQIDAGIDPRVVLREEKRRDIMTVSKAHELYMVAVNEGRSSRAKRPNKPRTVKDKIDIFELDIKPVLGTRCVYEVTERDLINLVEKKGRKAKIRANRLAAELKVFFGWAASLRGLAVGLETDPSRRLGDLRFPETPRSRKLSMQEIEWFLAALVEEQKHFQRGMLLWLLTAARISEVANARTDEIEDGIWTIPSERSKNSTEHRIALGPWGLSLMESGSEWVFPGDKIKGPRNRSVWYKARDRVHARMIEASGQQIERFTPHDFRRTARSNTKRLNVDFDTAEAMLNHVKKGLERTYDLYEMEEEKRAWFLKWEREVAAIAERVGVAEELGVPPNERSIPLPAVGPLEELPKCA
ncbi:tyrosine-type recombinase/integrase [Novosphingobium sp. B 225]|uniref:tyrosine-type recombinase/integrase n=1 Tax=Novosphingobium sp. B 225 TaxID=1961849 RepID=UPI0015958DE1|nr:integrase arm-type DNA-binding domain-containing protein [Novosphingobium sp. B 225]